MVRNASRIVSVVVVAMFAGLGCIATAPGLVAQDAGPDAKPGPDPAEDDYFFARGLDAKGHVDLAIAEYRKFLKRHGSHRRAAEVHYLLGTACYNARDFAGGAAVLGALRERFPRYPLFAEAMFRLGGCELELGRFGKAAAAYAAAADHGGKDGYLAPEARYWQAESLFRAKNWNAAARTLDGFAKRHPKSDKVGDALALLAWARYHGGAFAETVTAADALLARRPSSAIAAEANYLKGESLLELGRAADAAKAFDATLRAAPDGRHATNALDALAIAHFRAGAFAAAASAYDRRAARGDDAAARRARLMAATAAYRAGDDAGVRRRVAPLLSRPAPIGAEAAYLDGLAADRLGDPVAAIAATRAGLAKSPEAPLRGKLLVLAGGLLHENGKAAEAAAAYDAAVATDALGDLDDDARYGAGLGYHVAGRFDVAEKRLSDLLARHPASDLVDEARFTLAENAYRAGDMRTARARFSDYLKRADPKRVRAADAYYKLGHAALAAKDLPAAIDAFERHGQVAKADDPLTGEVRFLLGTAYRDHGDASRAKAAFEACARTPGAGDFVARALLELGNAAAARGDREAALGHFDRLDRGHPDSDAWASARYGAARVLIDAGRHEDAEKRLRASLARAKRPEVVARLRFTLAQVSLARGRYDAAIAEAEAVLAIKGGPLHADALEIVGHAALKKGDAARALATYDRFLANDPKHDLTAFVRFSRGLALDRLDRHADAVAAFDDTLRRHPRFDRRDMVLYYRALAKGALGDDRAMADDLQTLVRKHPKSPLVAEADLRLGEVAYAASRWADAIAAYDAVLARDGIDPTLAATARYKAGWAHMKSGDRVRAAARFDALAERHPSSPLRGEAWFHAAANLRPTDPKAALERYRRLVREIPSHELVAAAKLGAGECAIALRDWPGALEWFADARRSKLSPADRLRALFGLGVANQGLERFEAAVQSLTAVAAADGSDRAAESRFRVARCRAAQGRVEDALGDYLKVSMLHGASRTWASRALLEAARVYADQGRGAQARRLCAELVQRYPDASCADEARTLLAQLAPSDTKGADDKSADRAHSGGRQ